MGHRTLEITIQYAEDLSKVNFISKMDVYVVVSISGGDEHSNQKTKTTVSHGDDANPTWSFPMKFAVEEAALLQNRLILDFKIKCDRALGDRLIGEVHVPVKQLLDSPPKRRTASAAAAACRTFVSYQVKKPSGKPKGKLTFSYQFRDKAQKTTTCAVPPPPPPPPEVEEVHGGSTITYPLLEPSSPFAPTEPGRYPPIPQQPVAAPAAEVYAESLTLYPVVEPTLPYLQPIALGYPPIKLEHRVVAPPPVEEVYGETTAAYPVLEPTSPYPPAAKGYPLIPPPRYQLAGGLKLDWYPPPPPPPPRPYCVYPPQACFGHPPPMMQLAPDWWVVDWRHDAQCRGF